MEEHHHHQREQTSGGMRGAMLEISLKDCHDARDLTGIECLLSNAPGVQGVHLDRTRAVAHVTIDPQATNAAALHEALFRHYWVLITFVLTLFSTVVVLLHMPTVTSLAAVAREADGAALRGLGGHLFHPGVGLLVLLVITVLNVYKPRGLTPYGWRKQHEQGAPSQP